MSITRAARGVFHADVIIVGGGLIGLACASAVARTGRTVLILRSNEPGAASGASAGIIAPFGYPAGPIRTLGCASRDMYPAYVESLVGRTDVRVGLDLGGVLEVAFAEQEASALRATADRDDAWIDATTLAAVEPGLAPAPGAVLHPKDGAVDSAALLRAMRLDAERDSRIAFRDGRVVRLDSRRLPLRVAVESGDWFAAPAIVLAAGAWVSSIAGLPHPVPITPIRGQILTLPGRPLRHVIMSTAGYIVSREDRSLVGTTMESVGFDASTTEAGATLLRDRASEICPVFASSTPLEHWAGLRPVTPDLLPLVGPESDCEGLFYACGHSRNGVLLAPLTASVIADLVATGSTALDVSPYAPSRFWTGR